MTLVQPFAFVTSTCTRWTVPAGATVDGASIPSLLWSMVGGPLEGLYRDASVVHDWYCSIRIEPSDDVHRVFYDAMIASGVDKDKALSFYWAVRKFGPSWDNLTIRNNRLAEGKPAIRDDRHYRHLAYHSEYTGRADKLTRADVLRIEKLARDRNLEPADIEQMADSVDQ